MKDISAIGATALVAWMACACGGEAPVIAKPAAAAVSADAAREPATLEAPAGGSAGSHPTVSLAAVAILDAEDLQDAGPAETAPSQSPDLAQQGPASQPAAVPLPPAVTAILLSGAAISPLDPLDDLAIAFEQSPDDTLPLALTATSIVEDTMGDGNGFGTER